MFDKKYNKILTIVIIVVAIIALGVFGFWGYNVYKRYYVNKGANEALNQFDNKIETIINKGNQTGNSNANNTQNGVSLNINSTIEGEGNQTGNGTAAVQTYKGFTVCGKIEIPSISLSYPVLDRATKASMEASVGISYGPGLNQVGNTVIMGHNYRDRTFFSNLKNVKENDAIYITDTTGKRVKYTVYNIYETGSSDFEYASRDTAGKMEITLSTCTDDVQSRLVIWAKAY